MIRKGSCLFLIEKMICATASHPPPPGRRLGAARRLKKMNMMVEGTRFFIESFRHPPSRPAFPTRTHQLRPRFFRARAPPPRVFARPRRARTAPPRPRAAFGRVRRYRREGKGGKAGEKRGAACGAVWRRASTPPLRISPWSRHPLAMLKKGWRGVPLLGGGGGERFFPNCRLESKKRRPPPLSPPLLPQLSSLPPPHTPGAHAAAW